MATAACCFFGACASALRMKCTRQRCQVVPSTLAAAAFSPSWASEITSCTPRRPRRVSWRRKSVQNGSASLGPHRQAQRLAATIRVYANRHYCRYRHDPSGLPLLEVGRVDPQVRPVALDRPVQEGLHPLVDLRAQPRHLALEMPLIPIACTRSSIERVDSPPT